MMKINSYCRSNDTSAWGQSGVENQSRRWSLKSSQSYAGNPRKLQQMKRYLNTDRFLSNSRFKFGYFEDLNPGESADITSLFALLHFSIIAFSKKNKESLA